jgi:hypothetical protein
VVNFADLVKLAQNYNTALPGADSLGSLPADFQSDFAAALATVPEPATAVPLVTLAALATARRRRRSPRHAPPNPGR